MEKTAPEGVKYFISILIQPDMDFDKVVDGLTETFGDSDWISPSFSFDLTDYYEAEMGANLERRFLSLMILHSPADLVAFKEKTLLLEKRWMRGGKRSVNLDPGYIDYNKVVLASLKPGGWKIYLDRGVWADMNLYYSKGSFLRFGWTFPDFRTGKYDRALMKIRSIYKEQIR